jgi:haloalkane dehalogenase
LTPSGPASYRFVEHRRYLDALLDALDVHHRVTLVLHDWGSALGFDWANRHHESIRGIAYMEAFVRPLTWDEWPDAARPVFRALRSPAGERLILERNIFLEQLLPASVLRKLTDAEQAEYRRPYPEPGEQRRPMLTWPRELPINGAPADVVGVVEAYGRWLEHSELPKLFINAEPGAILVGAQRQYCRGWRSQREVTVRGRHFIQEDAPDEIGHALAAWYRELP